MFDNYTAPKVFEKFKEYWSVFGSHVKLSDNQTERSNIHFPTNKRVGNRKIAWDVLFEGKRLEDIVEEINIVWIDPNYRLVIGIELVKK